MTIFVELAADSDICLPTPARIVGLAPSSPTLALRDESGRLTPLQRDGDDFVALLSSLSAAGTSRFQFVDGGDTGPGVVLAEGDGILTLGLPEGDFGTYHYGRGAYGEPLVRPYLWPLCGPGQTPVTRIIPPPGTRDEEMDHVHHHSLWTAFDEVNHVNNWTQEEGHGFTRHQEFTERVEGPVFGGFTACSLWLSNDEKPVMTENRRLRLYNAGADYRLLDYDVTWTASHGAVTVGDTKESGVVAVRVHPQMTGLETGLIINAAGGRGEAECWGQKAAWCDYSGEVEGRKLGVAIFDHPSNPGFPTRWMVRDYGLFATNPFSTAAFGAGAPTPFTLEEGDSVNFRYRLLVHRGNGVREELERVALSFQAPPTVRIVSL